MNSEGLSQGEIIRALREEKGLSRRKVGLAIYGDGAGRRAESYVQNRETGHVKMTEQEIDTFAAFFRIDPGTIRRAPHKKLYGKSTPNDQIDKKPYETLKKPVNADNALEEKINTLEAENKTLEDRNKALKEENESLKSRIAELEKEAKATMRAERAIKLIKENTQMKNALAKLMMREIENANE